MPRHFRPQVKRGVDAQLQQLKYTVPKNATNEEVLVFKTCIILGLTASGEVSKLEVDGCKDQKKLLLDEKEIRKKLRQILSGGKQEKDNMMERIVLKAYDQLTKDGNGTIVTEDEKARAGNKLKEMWPSFSFPAVPATRQDSKTSTPPQTPTGSGSSSTSTTSSSTRTITSTSTSSTSGGLKAPISMLGVQGNQGGGSSSSSVSVSVGGGGNVSMTQNKLWLPNKSLT